MADDSAPTDVSVLKRISLRLDNGTRIGSSSALGMGEGASGVVKLDFVEGFTRGLVSEADLIRISEIAGQLEARRTSAAAGPGAPKPAGSKVRVQTAALCQLHATRARQSGVAIYDTQLLRRACGRERVRPGHAALFKRRARRRATCALLASSRSGRQPVKSGVCARV